MLKTRKFLLIIPTMTLFANIAILLNIPLLREVILFVFLSFIPGFAILRIFKLKEFRFLDTIIFSVALSIAFVMFIGLLINGLYLFLGLSQPLSTIPLTTAISAFTLLAFFIDYRRDLPETLKLKTRFEDKLKNIFPLSIILFFLPLLSAIGVLYLNVYALLLSCVIIAVLCVMSVVSRRLVPEKLFPFLIFSISIALVCQVLLTSKYIVGSDANLEYYVFKMTQLNGHWGSLNADVNSLTTLTFGSMLSVTLLPAVYSVLMGAQGEIVFKILYPFIFCFVPVALFRICEKQLGKLIGLISALTFAFTFVAFLGPEPLSLNRQIIGELFLLLSVLLLISNTIPVTKRRLLLIIFGAALAVSHYSLAYIYLAIVVCVFIASKIKPKLDDTLNLVTVFLLFAITFLWYALYTNWPFLSLTDAINWLFVSFNSGFVSTRGTATEIVAAAPQVFTVTSWINLLLTGISYLFLIMGALLIILKPRRTRLSAQFKILLTMAAVILIISIVIPNIAARLNFSRFYAITMLFLSPCFVLGGQALLATIGKAWTKISQALKRQSAPKRKKIDRVLLLVAIILSAYFLSQVGFINRVGNGTIYFYSTFFETLKMSNESQDKIFLYGNYIPEQDVFSASWLHSYKVETAEVFADTISAHHVLFSYGLIPDELLLPLTNTTIPPQASLIYLGRLNVENGVATLPNAGTFNISEISTFLDKNNLVYSNGNSEIWYVTPTP